MPEVRLIDANALKERLPTFAEVIDDEPTIEAEPVRHGRWIDRYFGDKCSECGFEISRTNSVFKCAFCPNCGAKLDGGAENDT